MSAPTSASRPPEVGETERRIKTEKPDDPSLTETSAGKRICIQDAEGKVFFLQCPEGFSGGEGDESSVPLSAWVASTTRKKQSGSTRKSGVPASTTPAALVKLKKSKVPTGPITLSSSEASRWTDKKPIQYETGYDPVTGEVKGPDIDPTEIFGSGFNRNESAAVRDVKSTDDLNKAWFTTAKDKEALLDKGINWKQGAWSQEEVAVLTENIKEYCAVRGIEDPAHVIFNMSKEERSDFYPTIAKGLQRPLFAVYRRVKRDYDVNNHKGVYTQAELTTLKLLLDQYGSDWKLIGEKLGRSAQSVKDRCRQFKEAERSVNNGKWTPEEEKRLVMAVHEVGRPAGSSLPTEGAYVVGAGKWREVAALVKTRTEKQCRLKWSEVVKASIAVAASVEGTSANGAASAAPPTSSVTSSTRAIHHNGIAEWGTEEDAQLLNALNKVVNGIHGSGEFKTSSLDAADFGNSVVSAVTGSTAPQLHASNEHHGRETTIAAAIPVPPTAVTANLLTSIPLAVPASLHPDHAVVTSTIHVPAPTAPSLQHHHHPHHHHPPHHAMPETSYVWTHHAL